MVTLKCPFFWNGRLIREGSRISLPAEVEERLLRAGNAAPEAGKESQEENTPEKGSPKSGRKQAEQVELTLGR